jgi:hypothetical protein
MCGRLTVARRVPRGLAAPGRALWRALLQALPGDAEYDERELAQLEHACRLTDTLARLDEQLEAGVTVLGSRGQVRLHPALVEARQTRLAIARLLGELELPTLAEDERMQSAASRRASNAANARWARRDDLRARREEAGHGA